MRKDKKAPGTREELSRFKMMIEASCEEVYLVKPDGEFVYVNEAAARSLGYTPDEMLGIGVAGIDPVYGPVFLSYFEDIKRREGPPVETCHVARDGSKVFKEMKSVYLNIDGNEYVCGFGRDITKRKRIEDELRASEDKLKSIFRAAPTGIGLVSKRVIMEANERLCEMTGYAKEELIGQSARILYPADEDYEFVGSEKYRQITQKGTGTVETRWKKKDGSMINVLLSSTPLDINDLPKGVTFTALDITRLKQAEEERIGMERRLLHAQKLESLGVLAGGIAHDFNNLLMAILGNLDLALMSMSNVAPARSNIEQAVQATHMAAELTRQMLAYSGKGRFIVSEIDINELVEENAQLFRASISRNTIFNLNLDRGISPVEADAGQVQQIIMNLITNASEAIGEKAGAIALSTAMMDCDDEYLSQSRIEEKPHAGRFTCLEVTDTGCGMDRDVQDRLFDPFFTTKFTGRGLGMCAVLGIVRGHEGALFIESSVGKGTTVKVFFPAARQATVTAMPTDDTAVQQVSGERPMVSKQTILLVDDEDMVRQVCMSMLEKLGFKVIAAKDGMEAVDIFKERAREIDCVLLDLSMPRMDGLAAFKEMILIKPGIKAILVSGYNEQEAIQRFSAQGLAGFIQKPYRLQVLRKELNQTIGK